MVMGRILRRLYLVLGLAICAGTGTAQIVSDFTAGTDNWSTPNDADGTIGFSTTGGNPTGHVFGTPFALVLGATTIYGPYHFVAAGKFLGNRSAYYNGTLRYDAQQSSTGVAVQEAEVIMTTNAGISIYYFPPTPFSPPAAPIWQTYSVSLGTTGGFWKTTNSASGTAATQAQIQNTLADLATLQIRALSRQANVTNRLDNVTMMPPIIVSTQPATVSVCVGATATFTTAATNNAAITYRWQFESSPGVFTDISDGAGYSGTGTTTLSVNTTGGFGIGNYRARIGGYAADDVFTNAAILTNNTPNAPTTTPASSCSTGSLTLTAAGGAAGQYRWYTVATGGTPIAGQTNATFATPVLSATTTYYVSINNGTCEGTRTPVTATINTTPNPPTVTGSTACVPGSQTLTASGGAAGQYRWYTVATGGVAIAGQTNSTFNTPSISATTSFYVSISNGTCESARVQVTATVTTICNNQPPVIETAETSTIIGGKISINLATRISDSDNNLDLSTLTIVTPPASGAKASIDGSFNLIVDYTGLKFSGTENILIRVCDTFGACSQQSFAVEVIGDIRVYNALSPNKNGKNDVFFIEYIDLFAGTKSNTVKIFNRWGDLVWEGKNYDNTKVAFSGKSSNGGDLPSGTYYYKIEFSGRKPEVGYLELRR